MLSQTVEYALRATVCLAAWADRRLTTQQLSDAGAIPAGYLPKVLASLVRAGLVDGQRGLGGGYRLTRPADQVTALEVIEAVEPFPRLDHCPLDRTGQRVDLCPLHRLVDQSAALLQAHFGAATLASLQVGADGRAIECGFPRAFVNLPSESGRRKGA